MLSIHNAGKKIWATVQGIEQAVRASFEESLQNEAGVEGFVQKRDFFFSMVKATIRCSDMAHKMLDAWKNAVVRRDQPFDADVEKDLKQAFLALLSLTEFLFERANPTHADGGFALRPSPLRMLKLCHQKAKRIVDYWTTPVPAVPVVHEPVVLSPEGVQVWEDAMNRSSSTGKPFGYKPRQLADDSVQG